jgi:hypothetical protein
MMRHLANTTTVIASIAVAIVLLFMAPKEFETSEPDPIVAAPTDTFARTMHEAARPSQAGRGGLQGLAGLIEGLTG